MNIKSIVATALLSFVASTSAQEKATFSSATGELTVPQLLVDGVPYQNAVFSYEGGLNFMLKGIEEVAQCSSDNINFSRYQDLSGIDFFEVVTEEQLNGIIGCDGELVPDSTSDTQYLRWSLASSSESCPRFIQAELGTQEQDTLIMSGISIQGINSETNEPYPCE